MNVISQFFSSSHRFTINTNKQIKQINTASIVSIISNPSTFPFMHLSGALPKAIYIAFKVEVGDMPKMSLFFKINATWFDDLSSNEVIYAFCVTTNAHTEMFCLYMWSISGHYNTSLVNILLNPISAASILCHYIFFSWLEREHKTSPLLVLTERTDRQNLTRTIESTQARALNTLEDFWTAPLAPVWWIGLHLTCMPL